MVSPLSVPATLRTIAALASIATVVGQTSSYETAIASYQNGDHAAALRALDADPDTKDRLDHLYLRARILAAHGTAEQAAAARRAFEELYARRLGEVTTPTDTAAAAPASSGQPASPTAPVGPHLGDELGRAIDDAASPDPEVRAAARATLKRELPNLAAAVPQWIAAAGPSSAVQRAKACIELARAEDPETAAVGRAAMQQILVALVEQDADAETDEGWVVYDYDDPVRTIVTAFHELHAEREVIEAIAALAWRKPTARALRIVAATFTHWAAELEAMDEGEQLDAGVEDYFDVALRLYHEPHTRGAGEQALVNLRGSRHADVAGRARAELGVAMQERLSRAEEFEGEDEAESAAEEYAAIADIDPTRTAAAARAADLFERAGAIGEAARYLELLTMHADAELAERSWQRLVEYWRQARARIAELEQQRQELPEDPAAAAGGLLGLVRRLLPVLEGRQLDEIRRLLANREFEVALDRLDDLIRAVKTGEPTRPTTIGRTAGPEIGRDFELRELGLRGFWVAPTETEPGFWCGATLTDAELWRRVVQNSKFDVTNNSGGSLMLSRDNADMLCAALTEYERAARRLPPDRAYALPTRAQLDRLQRSGRLPDTRGMWLWTAEGIGRDPGAQSRPLPFIWRAGEPDETDFVWNKRYDVGFVIVLTRVGR